MQIEV